MSIEPANIAHCCGVAMPINRRCAYHLGVRGATCIIIYGAFFIFHGVSEMHIIGVYVRRVHVNTENHVIPVRVLYEAYTRVRAHEKYVCT